MYSLYCNTEHTLTYTRLYYNIHSLRPYFRNILFFLHYTSHQIIVIIFNSEFYLSDYKQNGKLVSVVRQCR